MWSIKELTVENPVQQAWSLLRMYLDHDTAIERMRAFHRIPHPKQKANLEKQAEQLAYCIRQAHEYFDAANRVTLITRPTLIYYGVVSLSQAVVLLKQSGEYSFDSLRKRNKHHHHGLDPKRGFTSQSTRILADFLGQLGCSIRVQNGAPWGLFPLFYESLDPPATIQRTQLDDLDTDTSWTGMFSAQWCEKRPLSELVLESFCVYDLAAQLPDLFFTQYSLGLVPDLLSGRVQIRESKSPLYGMPKGVGVRTTYDFLLKDFVAGRLAEYVAWLHGRLPQLTCHVHNEFHARLTRVYHRTIDSVLSEQVETPEYFPDVVDDTSGNPYYVINPGSFVIEPASMYIIAFCLGIAARYHPDIWVRAVDENAKIAEWVTAMLSTISRKFPTLILDQLSGVKHLIHS